MKNLLHFFLDSLIFLPLLYAADDELTVREALELARERNPLINQLREELKIKNAEWWGGWGISDPSI